MRLQAALPFRSQDTATHTGSKSTIWEPAFISPTTDSPRLGGPGMPRMPAPPRRCIRPCHWRWARLRPTATTRALRKMVASWAYPAGKLCCSAQRPPGRRKYPGPWGSGRKPIHPFEQTSSYRPHQGRTASQTTDGYEAGDLKGMTGDLQMRSRMGPPAGSPLGSNTLATRINGRLCNSLVSENGSGVAGTTLRQHPAVRLFRRASKGTCASQGGESTASCP